MSIRQPVNYRKLAPEGTFIHDYMLGLSEQETAISYDFWSGLWLLGACIGRSVCIARPRAPVFFNWYVVFVGDSGVTRKSSAILHARKLLAALAAPNGLAANAPSAYARITLTVDGKVTPEKLLEMMNDVSAMTGETHVNINVSELITLMGRERYAMALPGLLTDLYDCRDTLRLGGTLDRGEVELRNTFVTLLSGSTPSWLMRAINPDVVEGGFTSRTIFVPAEKPKRLVSWPEEGRREQGEVLQSHLHEIRRLAAITPHIFVSPSGLKAFDDWYRHRPRGDTAYLRSFESREDAHVLRLAGMLAVNDRSWIIDARKVRASVRVISEVKSLASLLFSNTGVASKAAASVERIRRALIDAGNVGVLQSVLYAKVRGFVTVQMFNTLMEIMHELQLVSKFEERGRVGRPSVIWRGTSNIVPRGSIDVVLKEIENA